VLKSVKGKDERSEERMEAGKKIIEAVTKKSCFMYVG
jgi:hypothetical protein